MHEWNRPAETSSPALASISTRWTSIGESRSSSVLSHAAYTTSDSLPSSDLSRSNASSIVPPIRLRLSGAMHLIGLLQNEACETAGLRECLLGPEFAMQAADRQLGMT